MVCQCVRKSSQVSKISLGVDLDATSASNSDFNTSDASEDSFEDVEDEDGDDEDEGKDGQDNDLGDSISVENQIEGDFE